MTDRVPPRPGIRLESLLRAALLQNLGRAGGLTTNAVVAGLPLARVA